MPSGSAEGGQPPDVPLELWKATLPGSLDTRAVRAGHKEQLRRIVQRALRPGCPPSSLTRWIRSLAANVIVDASTLSNEQTDALVEAVTIALAEVLNLEAK